MKLVLRGLFFLLKLPFTLILFPLLKLLFSFLFGTHKAKKKEKSFPVCGLLSFFAVLTALVFTIGMIRAMLATIRSWQEDDEEDEKTDADGKNEPMAEVTN